MSGGKWHARVKVADREGGTKCCASSLLIYSILSEVRDWVNCTELEIQLQEVRDGLRSVQLIIPMLNKEHVQEDTVATPIQEM